MFCPNCGIEVPDGSAFCPECGTRIDGATQKIAGLRPPVPLSRGRGGASLLSRSHSLRSSPLLPLPSAWELSPISPDRTTGRRSSRMPRP